MRISILLAMTLIALPIAAEDPPAEDAEPRIVQQPLAIAAPVLGPPIQPVAPNISRAPGLGDLVLAKVDVGDEGASVIMMIESFRDEKRKVMVTKIQTEARERTMVFDGEEKTVTYEVQVPITEEVEMVTKTPAGPKPKSIDVEDFQFYNLTAEPITIDEVAKKLTALRPIFLLDQMTAEPLALPDIARRAMHEDCVIAVTESKVREMRQQARWWAPNALPVFRAPAAPLPVVPAPVLPDQIRRPE